MCSIPVSLLLGPHIMPALLGPMMYMLPALQGVMFVISLCAAVCSRAAYKHCTSTTGHPRTRAVLMLFNFIARPLADGFVVILVISAIVRVVRGW